MALRALNMLEPKVGSVLLSLSMTVLAQQQAMQTSCRPSNLRRANTRAFLCRTRTV